MINRRKQLEKACLSAFRPAFHLELPRRLTSPVIFASPHSGRFYPKAFQSLSRLPLSELQRNEDSFVDRLFLHVTDMGAPLLHAHFPRSFLDLNRAASEIPRNLEPSAIGSTPRARLGLGVVPEIVAENMAIYDKPLTLPVIKARIDALHTPYHAALSELVNTVRSRHGRALLIDCHSMPGFAALNVRRADIILGDRYGVSCRPETLANIEAAFQSRGYSVTRNYPYAGGYVTAHYADLDRGVETLQIEINRDLYLNPVTGLIKPGYDLLKTHLRDITTDIITDFNAPSVIAAQ